MKTTKTKPRTVAERIARLRPCGDATEWAAGYTSPAKAWRECRRGDWMPWLSAKASGPSESEGRKKLVLAARECARIALPIFERCRPGDGSVRECLDTAERWARGEATLAELRAAKPRSPSCARRELLLPLLLPLLLLLLPPLMLLMPLLLLPLLLLLMRALSCSPNAPPSPGSTAPLHPSYLVSHDAALRCCENKGTDNERTTICEFGEWRQGYRAAGP
ncbi:MAG: putative immunity protein [Pyrinomonadaceae bacterium]